MCDLADVSARSLLEAARNELYSGLFFNRAGETCDERDITHLYAALALIETLLKAQ